VRLTVAALILLVGVPKASACATILRTVRRIGSIASTTRFPRSSYAIPEVGARQHENRACEISPFFRDCAGGTNEMWHLRCSSPRGA
jgi:hypothetical protein